MSLPSGIDTAAQITPLIAQKAKSLGQSFIGRYLVPHTESFPSKDLNASEAAAIHEAGLGILLCWETTANRARQGESAGKADGTIAYQLATKMRVPYTTCIYFAVDYNAPKSDYNAIEQYIRAASKAIEPYQAGVYGHYGVCEEMYLRGATVNLWQCCAWSGKLISPHAYIYQRQWSGGAESKALENKIGVPVDMNTCGDMKKARLWMPGEKLADTPWYAEAMEWVKNNGLMEDERPNDPLTRAELATVLMRYEKMRK